MDGLYNNKLFHALWVFAACAIFAIAAGCGGGGGGGGDASGATTPPASTTLDTTAPTIAFAYPAANAEFTVNALPQYVQLTYADAGGLDLSTLSVTLTLNSRTIDLTGLFATDSVQNAATTRTDSADTNPLYRTAVTRFARTDTGFASPAGTATVPRGAASSMNLECLDHGTGRAMVWSTGLDSVYPLPASGAFQAAEVALGFNPVVAGAATDTIFAARDGFTQLFAVNADTGSVSNIINVPDEPALLAFHAETGKMYVAYENAATLQVSRLDTSLGTVDQTIAVTFPPALLGTRTGDGAEGVFMVGSSAGQFRLFPYDGTGAQGTAAALGLTQPSDMAFEVSSGDVYLSRFDTGSVTRAQSTGATSDITVGSNPRRVFRASQGGAFTINSGAKSISYVQGAAVSSTATLTALPLDGLADCGADYTYLLEDLWSLDTQTPGTLTATVKDTAGNTGSTAITLQFSPETIGGIRLAGN